MIFFRFERASARESVQKALPDRNRSRRSGLIAFAVDYSTGCIYLPPGNSSTDGADAALQVVRLDPQDMSRERLEEIISERAGRPVRLKRGAVEAYRLSSADEINGLLHRRTE